MRALTLAVGAMLLLAVGAALARAPGPVVEGAAVSTASSVTIRGAPDGSGPAQLFWLSGPPAGRGGEDMVGIVDPLFAAVRLYAVARPPSTGAIPPLGARLRPIGACALPIDFRAWQLFQLKDRVILEMAPDPGPAGFQVTAAALKTTAYVIRRDLVRPATTSRLRQAGADIARASWDPAQAPPCGALATRPTSLGSSAPYRARRVAPLERTILLRNTARALAPARPLKVSVRRGPRGRLYSAHELEPAGRLRVVQITEGGPSGDGMVRMRQRLLVFDGATGRARAEVEFDETMVRGKLGQRPMAVMPSGELLLMGKSGDSFQILSCGRLGGGPLASGQACPSGRNAVALAGRSSDATGSARSAEPATVGTAPHDAGDIFRRMNAVATHRWRVDAARLPRDCRAPEGCAVTGQAVRFAPIAGLRLSRGVYERKGLPYAQTEGGVADADRFLTLSRDDFGAALANVHRSARNLPGNLADGLTGDLGIDCSALIQLAWGGDGSVGRLSTVKLQAQPQSYGCPDRLPGPEHLRPGDAIALHVDGEVEHAVLFAEPLTIDGASDSWLVMEASSGCGGVCWSLYDPAYFNGWGLYRAAARADRPCPRAPAASIARHPIPTGREDWLRRLRGK